MMNTNIAIVDSMPMIATTIAISTNVNARVVVRLNRLVDVLRVCPVCDMVWAPACMIGLCFIP